MRILKLPKYSQVDRDRLRALPRGRSLTAYVGKFGRGGMNPRTRERDRTVLLRRIAMDGVVVLDHQWFRAGEWSEHLSKLDIVILEANGLEQYNRGYARNGNKPTDNPALAITTPTAARVVKPVGFPGLIIKRIDQAMVRMDNYDIAQVASLLRNEHGIKSWFQREVERDLQGFKITVEAREIAAKYLENRLHQYGSDRVNSRAIWRFVHSNA